MGLSSFGFKLGRDGELAWLCLATGSTVFLFDVARLGVYSALNGKPLPAKSSKTEASNEVTDASTKVTDPISSTNEHSASSSTTDSNEQLILNGACGDKFTISPKNCIYDHQIHLAIKENKSTMRSLHDILLNPQITKVNHDCRNLCDFLFHQCNVSINGIYDIQVTFFIVFFFELKTYFTIFTFILQLQILKSLESCW